MNKKYVKPPINSDYKKWIDNANYYELLKRWRFAENDDIFLGDTCVYYVNIMNQKSNALENSERIRISKLIGWDK